MKKFLLFTLASVSIASVFFLVFFSPFTHATKKAKKRFIATEEKAFVIIIPSYNNEKFLQKNLSSVFSQNYQNYRVIYIDDNSNDNTLAKATQLLQKLDKQKKATLLHNTKNYGGLANVYNAIHTCSAYEIVVLLDGDDYFAHEDVLSTLNQTYANPSVWMTYGNYLDYPSFQQKPQICKKIPKKIYKNRNFRKYKWTTSHLRSFYASLFKEIKIEDFFYKGKLYPMGWDLALMYPLLEMAGKDHIAYVKKVLYLYNRKNPLSDHKVNLAYQSKCAAHISAKEKYPPLLQLSRHHSLPIYTDGLIFSEDNPLQLYCLLESLQKFAKGIEHIFILYRASSPEIENAYIDLKHAFPTVQFLPKTKDFKSLLEKILSSLENRYVFFANDQLLLQHPIDFSKAVQELEKTKAYGLYFSHHLQLDFSSHLQRHQPIPNVYPLAGITQEETPIAWQFSSGVDDWNCPNNFNLALYCKDTLQPLFETLEYACEQTLFFEWGLHAPLHAIGLFYPSAKCIKVHLPKVFTPKMLLQKFQEGAKIDFSSLCSIESPCQEITANISFISRD